MRWPQLPDIGVVDNGGVVVKYKGITEAIGVDEQADEDAQPRMEGNDAVCCQLWTWRAILRQVGFYPAL